MQPLPNRMGLGLRPNMPAYGQGPSMSGIAQHPPSFVPQAPRRSVQLFVGSISGGVTDIYLSRLLGACGKVASFKRLITPANKPQGFGFAEYEDPDSALRAIELLNGVELPALEDGCVNKKLLVKADEKTKVFLDAYSTQRMRTDAEEALMQRSRADVKKLVDEINEESNQATNDGRLDKERYVIPPHLHDLHEADLPETQRGLVISEIAQFRERAAKREREKMREQPKISPALLLPPAAPKVREWGKPQTDARGALGVDAQQGYNKPVGFVKEGSDSATPGPGSRVKSDEDIENERKEARRRDEENSFRDRERRYEPRERSRIQALERTIQREKQTKEAEERDREEMKNHLHVWDDDASDELFYTDRARWRTQRARRLAAEEQADSESRAFEEREAEHLRRESEAFLARQMEEMQSLAEEQRKAGMLLDDGAPVKLNVSLAPAPVANQAPAGPKDKAAAVFGQEEEEEEAARRRKAPLVKLDFSAANDEEKAKERLQWIRESVPHERDALFKAKVRWDGVNETMIDRKFEPLVKKLMVKYLGELEDDDLVLFVLEHLKDHKSPAKLIEGLEPVLEEEAAELAISVWRQVIFESMAYGEGLLTGRMMVD
ncbi:hypothetical protein K488DRAFT_41458 [Vararia minispora EC-137]|uniref:Uncharacterized protein n=1 Tax=Vararia minispora EC-137 TaxID=1314806 RepID=A0ACB8QXB1_9AGAM|nr:hypothetical protein K488DRAFT_41458 [Vararia minispora EC-137]